MNITNNWMLRSCWSRATAFIVQLNPRSREEKITKVKDRHMSLSSSDDTRYRHLVQGVTDYAIYMLDLQGYVTDWNKGAERAQGYSSAEIIGRHFSCFYSRNEQIARLPDANLDVARQTGRFETQGWRFRSDGSRFWANVVIDAIYIDGTLAGFAKITRDCTEQRQQALELQAMSSKLGVVLSVLPYGACLLDGELRIQLCNPAFQDLFGPHGGSVPLSENVIDLIRTQAGPSDDAAILDLSLFFHRREQWDASYELTLGAMRLSIILRSTDDQWAVATFQDVTERFNFEKAMLHRARHDSLTGLANRDALEDHIEAQLCQPEKSCTVIYLDLDKFKVVNDTYGHLAGDTVLKETARRILRALRPDDFVCRLGGDEFVVVPASLLTAEQARRLCKRLCKRIGKPFSADGRRVEVGVSIGIATYPDAGTTKDDLIGSADMALYQAKRSGGGYCVYDEAIGLSVLQRRSTELELRGALDKHEFQLHYQPICGSDGENIKGFEALIRWTQSSGVMVSPVDFIPLAEELGLMAEIGGWVIATACREAASWPCNLTVAVNVSATQMHDDKFIDRVTNALMESGLAAHRLEIEITETAMITNLNQTLSILTRLREMGILVAIDDFGTGYSSLSYLQTLPFTRIKIDRSFVCDIATNSNSMAIVKAVMRMSQDLGLSVTAEGVETEEQRLILLGEACQEIQGYLIAKPMVAEKVGLFLRGLGSPCLESFSR